MEAFIPLHVCMVCIHLFICGGGLGWCHILAVVNSAIVSVGKMTTVSTTHFPLHTDPEVDFWIIWLFCFCLNISIIFILSFILSPSLCVYSHMYLCTCVHDSHVEVRGYLGGTWLFLPTMWILGVQHRSPVLALTHWAILSILVLVFLFFSFKMCVSGFVQMPTESRRGRWIPLSRSCLWLCLTWMLGTKLLSPARAVLTRSHLSSSQLQVFEGYPILLSTMSILMDICITTAWRFPGPYMYAYYIC